jgi:hypothetical protein
LSLSFSFSLGTPHKSFGGPGVGRGGKKNSLFENGQPKGKVLIISEDEDSSDPDDNKRGGQLIFSFKDPMPVDSIGLLDNEKRTTIEVITKGGHRTTIVNGKGGDNGYDLVTIGKKQVKKLVVTFRGSAAVTDIFFDSQAPVCEKDISIDFDNFKAGDVVSDLGYGVAVKARRKTPGKQGDLVWGKAMIFDSANPAGGDFDLGTPHESFGGPGIGDAGKKGKLYENSIAQDNVLIVSEDDVSPDDAKHGGSLTFLFDQPMDVMSLGLLDHEQQVKVRIVMADGRKTTIFNGKAGNNAFELLELRKPQVVKIIVSSPGSLAITNLDLCLDGLVLSNVPSDAPSDAPSDEPSDEPSSMPSDTPSDAPSEMPSDVPSDAPSSTPSDSPSDAPSSVPSEVPSDAPSDMPSDSPSMY